MKERWHKEKCVILSTLCLSLLLGTHNLYGQEAENVKVQQTANQVEVQQELGSTEDINNNQGDKNLEDNQSEAKQGQGSNVVQTGEGSTQEHNKGNKNSKAEEADDSLQICLSLAALFGIGSLTAVISSILYKLYLSRKVTSLPVLYYGKEKEKLYE